MYYLYFLYCIFTYYLFFLILFIYLLYVYLLLFCNNAMCRLSEKVFSLMWALHGASKGYFY
ncbi:hypothetical protein Bca4012_064725 [Brassica carinata]